MSDQAQHIGQLAARALDRIEREYGDQAQLRSAVLIFEVDTPTGQGHNVSLDYETLPGASPYHIAGLASALHIWLVATDPDPHPEPDRDDPDPP